jgi:sortase A
MRYTYRDGVGKKGRSKLRFVAALVVMFGGVYLLVNTLSPALPEMNVDTQAVAKKLIAEQPAVGENRIYLPQINVDVPVVDINGNETAALEKGAIHRAPSSGNPQVGGNYVVAAHRFNLGLTPDQTRAKSPFYHIDKLALGDQIYIDYNGKRYAYQVTEKKAVAENAVEIESRTDDDRLTLYSCELAGPKAGRDVVFAKLLGEVAWQGNKPVIKSKQS